jgi:hypothetical protein
MEPSISTPSPPLVSPTDQGQTADTPPPAANSTVPPPPPIIEEQKEGETNIPPVVTTGGKPKGKVGKKVIATILGILFLVGGVSAGVILVQRQQDIREKAAVINGNGGGGGVTPTPTPTLIPTRAPTATPTPTVTDCSFDKSKAWSTCPAECKDTVKSLSECYLAAKNWICTGKQWQPNYADPGNCAGSCPWPLTNGQCCPTSPDNCSNLGSKICIEDPFVSECTLWDNSCPSGQKYYWKAIAWSENYDELVEQYCRAKPTPTPGVGLRASCLLIRIFDADWNDITSQLSSLKAGDTIRFTVSGTTSSGNIDKARFRINSPTWRTDVVAKRPGTNDFYDEYTIPEGVTSFTINAQLHHTSSDVNWF